MTTPLTDEEIQQQELRNWLLDASLSEIQTEITRLKKANEQTIKVLARFPQSASLLSFQWYDRQAKPLLTNLKALRDGGE